MVTKSRSNDPMTLLQGAQSQGNLSRASMAVAQQVLKSPDLAQMMMEALGTPADQLKAVQQTLLTVVVDDSGSIQMSGNEQTMRDGVNMYLDAQKNGRFSDGIMASIIYLNGTVLDPYKPLAEATRLDGHNYQATLGTPLYDVACATLLSVIAETDKIESQTGANLRSWTIFFTDGHDEHSRTCDEADVAKIAKDMFANEGKHIISGFGIGDDFNWEEIFGEMGIPKQWIFKSSDDPKGLRAGFGNASRTTASALNQQAAGFSQQAIAGGFGNP